jgi:hypothetical protein
MSMSLTKMLNDPSLLFDADRLKEQTKKVEKDRKNISEAANQYNNKYHHEVEEGTRKTQLLIEDGKQKGLSEEETLQSYGKFLPSKRTPILNFLYFILREDGDVQEFENIRQEIHQKYGDSNVDEFVKEYLKRNASERYSSEFEQNRQKYNKEFGHVEDDFNYKNDNVNEPQDMENFIYGNVSTSDFQKLKKLKTLALSGECNEHESALAFTICKDLCKKLGLEFDKIPINNRKQ